MNAVEYLHTRGLVSETLVAAVHAEVQNDRLWISWLDAHGQEVYRKGRALNGAEEKYLPAKKGPRPALFGTPGAWTADTVVLVEGEIDALLAEQAGFPAFATGSATLSEATKSEGLAVLARKRLIILVADRDEAGARWRAELIGLLGHRVPIVEAVVSEHFKDLGELAEAAVKAGINPALTIRSLLSELTRLDDRPAARDVVDIASEAPEDLSALDIITGVLRRQSILLVTGEEGDGKTLFVEQLMRQLARGEPIFDHFSVGPNKPHKILFVDTEMLDAQVQPRIVEMDQRGLQVERGSIEWICSGNLDLAHSEEDRLYISGEIARAGADFVWIDSGGNSVDDPLDHKSVNPFFNWLDGLLRGPVIGAGLTLHPRKRPPQAEAARRFDDLFGSREWKGRAFTAFYLEDRRITCWKDRGFGLHRMWPSKGRYPRATLHRPGVEDMTVAPFRIEFVPGVADDVTIDELKGEIMRLIAEQPGELTQSSIRKRLNARNEYVAGALKDLRDKGVIIAIGGRKDGKGAKYRPSDDHEAWQQRLIDEPSEDEQEDDETHS